MIIKLVDIPDLPGAEAEAKSLIGKSYSYLACLSGGLRDNLGITLPDISKTTDDCSETVTRVLRGGGVMVLDDIPANDITPMDLLNALNKEAT